MSRTANQKSINNVWDQNNSPRQPREEKASFDLSNQNNLQQSAMTIREESKPETPDLELKEMTKAHVNLLE